MHAEWNICGGKLPRCLQESGDQNGEHHAPSNETASNQQKWMAKKVKSHQKTGSILIKKLRRRVFKIEIDIWTYEGCIRKGRLEIYPKSISENSIDIAELEWY